MSARARRRSVQRGFTLLEVMIALGILFTSLAVLIYRTTANVHMAERAEALGLATDLSRAKMYDLEEMLLKDGFQELDQEEHGDFSDEDHREFEWKAAIEKVELPSMGNMEALAGAGEEGADGEAGMVDSPLAGLLAMGGGDASAAAGASFLSSQFELISQVLESSIRKVTLTVTWKVGSREEELVTSAYFTDPSAVQRALSGIPTGGGGDEGEGGDETDTPKQGGGGR
ncbi:MAG TPA: type II secretion system protein [Kofleriaceae bacterium]|nr:type II secretion system protein [Kofleriaceae bacterium]